VPTPERDPRSYTPKHLADKILRSKSALEGERKHVTVLFCVLVDSTPLAERVGPEEMHAVMDRCFQIILERVHGYEGTVNQFLGDGVMTLFGAPLALEDAPRRACLAALAIQEALEPVRHEVRARHGVDLQWRIGIHSGPVVVGRIGDDLRMDYTAVGDTTNLAARLEKAAPPDGILISETTHRLVSGLFEVEDLRQLQLKGKSKPTRAFRVLSERRVSRIEAAAHTGLTPLCGRGRELAALQTAFDSASEGRGQVVFVVGEAGIGKSRLLHEFRRRLGDEPHAWFLGLCIPYGSAAFQPIVDGLRRVVGIEDQDDEETAVARVDKAVRTLGPDLDWTLPSVRHLLSLPVGDARFEEMDAITRRSETVKALNALFLSAAARRPLIFVIEDLHWSDPASEEFLAGLADSVPAARAMLVLTHRPGYAHPFGDRSYHARIAMQALSEQEMGEMAAALLGSAELPEALRHLIAGKAEGNPLFIEEVTKSLLEEGVLQLEDGRVEFARELAEIAIPDRIQDVLMARIDRLDETPKRAIQVASVIGREFALRLLQRIIEAGDAVHGVVDELRALELIYEKAIHPELAFMFKHALTHDVAYESVLVSRRRALHGIVGAAIEELYRDRLSEHYEKLAYHFERAEGWEKALEYHHRAAEKAART
jgi:class 3 adenylate cyclase